MNIAEQVKSALNSKEHYSPRAIQSREGILGPSDIGFCRQKATLTAKERGQQTKYPCGLPRLVQPCTTTLRQRCMTFTRHGS